MRDEYTDAGFVLEGVDQDKTRFIVRVRMAGSARGISVVYSSLGGNQLQRTARNIASSLRVALAHTDKVLAPDELQLFEDQATGVRLMIPRSLQGQEKRSQYGLSWQTDNLSISTLKFPAERVFRDIYETIKAQPGRRVVLDRYSSTEFVLEGVDQNKTHFIVKVRGDGIARGISVIYSSRAGPQLEKIARHIANSADEIGDPLTMGGTIIEPEVPTEAYLSQARGILALVAKRPDLAKELWADFGAATRKYRLRIGNPSAADTIQALLKEFPASPLHSKAWGVIPLGLLSNIAGDTYSTHAIYGSKTEHPSIRQELMGLLSHHPNDAFAFAAYYGTGAFDEAIAAAERSGVAIGMLHYAAGHKKLSSILELAIPKLEKSAAEVAHQTKFGDQDAGPGCPTNDVRSRCLFFETFTVHSGAHPKDRLWIFLQRAAKSDQAKVKIALERNIRDVQKVIAHFERAVQFSRGLPHEDDANYYLGVIFRHLGRRDEAIARFEKAMAFKDQRPGDYAYGSRRQMIQLLIELPINERVSIVDNSPTFSREPAIWYVLARDAYRRQDFTEAARLAELGLGRLGVETWRLPVTTETPRIADELRRVATDQSNDDPNPNLVELVYLLNASRDIGRFVRQLQDRPQAIQPKQIRSLILKYSLLTTGDKDSADLYAGRLGQHRDLRQALYLTDLVLKTIPAAASTDALREWLHYRKIRMLVRFEPNLVEPAVTAFEAAYPNSALIDDAYVEWLYVQAFALRSPKEAVSRTFRLITEKFSAGNAIDNAYNWYAIYLQCLKDTDGARRANMDIIRRFPLTRHSGYATLRLANAVGNSGGCQIWGN